MGEDLIDDDACVVPYVDVLDGDAGHLRKPR
jgi:hypothetical protein